MVNSWPLIPVLVLTVLVRDGTIVKRTQEDMSTSIPPQPTPRTTIHVVYLKICGCDLGEYRFSGRDLYDRRYSDVVLEASMHMYLKSMERTISPSNTPVDQSALYD